MIQNFPSHWQTLPFESAVSDVTAGKPKLQGSEYSKSGMLPIIDQGQDFVGGYTDDISLKANVNLPTIIFGDHTRVFKFVDFPFCLGADGTKILEPKVNLDKKFLFHYLNSLKINSAGYSRHYKFLKENVVPLPPLEEQKRIAAILDKADAIRRKRQQAIKLADEFLRAVFLDMFGDPVANTKNWPVKKWGDAGVIKIINGRNQSQVLDPDGEYPIIGSGGEMGRANNYLCPENTIVIGRKGNINKPLLIKEKFWNVDTAFGLVPNLNALSFNYLYWFCVFFDFERLNKTVTIPSLTKSDLLEIQIPLPDISIQNKFDLIVEKINGMKAQHSAGLELSNNSFNALSNRLFTYENNKNISN